jgi:HD domain
VGRETGRVTRETASAVPGVVALVRETGYRALVLERLLIQTGEMLGSSGAVLLVRHPDRPHDAIVAALHGIDPDDIGRTVPSVDERPPELLKGAAWVTVPASGGGRGLLGIEPAALARDHPELVAQQADLLGLVLEHAGMPPRLTTDVLNETHELAQSLDQRGPYAVEKSVELDLALAIADDFETDLAFAVELELAVLLYPLGWLALPERGAPSLQAIHTEGREFAAVAADTAAHVPGLEAVATVLRHTEERFDGSGGPAGLAGDRIPLASRITAACREYRALVSPRRGRPGMSHDRALAALRSAAGTQFDPRVVEALAAAGPEPA